MIEIVPASPGHVGTLAARMRAIDSVECRLFGRTPKQALRLPLQACSLAWTAKVDGRPEAMFGVSSISALDGLGSPWMLMTDEGPRHGRALVAMGRSYSDLIQRSYRRLENQVHRDNAVSIRWLERLGYTVEPGDAMWRVFWRERR